MHPHYPLPTPPDCNCNFNFCTPRFPSLAACQGLISLFKSMQHSFFPSLLVSLPPAWLPAEWRSPAYLELHSEFMPQRFANEFSSFLLYSFNINYIKERETHTATHMATFSPGFLSAQSPEPGAHEMAKSPTDRTCWAKRIWLRMHAENHNFSFENEDVPNLKINKIVSRKSFSRQTRNIPRISFLFKHFKQTSHSVPGIARWFSRLSAWCVQPKSFNSWLSRFSLESVRTGDSRVQRAVSSPIPTYQLISANAKVVSCTLLPLLSWFDVVKMLIF